VVQNKTPWFTNHNLILLQNNKIQVQRHTRLWVHEFPTTGQIHIKWIKLLNGVHQTGMVQLIRVITNPRVDRPFDKETPNHET